MHEIVVFSNFNAKEFTKEKRAEIIRFIKSIFPASKIKLTNGDNIILAIVEKKGKRVVVGFAHYKIRDKRIILKGLGVSKDYRGKSIGKRILDKLEEDNRTNKKNKNITEGWEIILKVKPTNALAIEIYSKAGFTFKKFDRNGNEILCKRRNN